MYFLYYLVYDPTEIADPYFVLDWFIIFRFDTVHWLSSAENRTRGSWVRSTNATFVLFKCKNLFFFCFQDTEHVGDVYQDETNQAAMLLYRDKTDDALLMVRFLLDSSCTIGRY